VVDFLNCIAPQEPPVFLRARNNLEIPVYRRDHQVLMLSVAQRCIEQAEKQTIAEIIGDDWVSSEELSHLARVRSICFQLKGILNESMQDTKKPLYSRYPPK
jgi:hypothetical protein